MSDNNNKKDPLERFFKKKSEEYKISFKEEDWLKLEKRLEVQNIKRIYRNRGRWLAAASIIIFSMLGYFTYDNHNRINQIQKLDSIITYEEEPAEILPDEEEINEDDPSAEIDFRATPLLGFEDQVISQTPSKVNKSNEGRDDELLRRVENVRNVTLLVGKKDVKLKKINLPYRSIEFNSDPIIAESDLIPLIEADHDKIDNQAYPRIAAGLVLSPDLSTVGSLSNFYNPGYKFGVNIEYNLSSNFAISSGIIQSKVRYLAYGENYNPYAYQSAIPTPSETIGECLLIDIPINLKYNFLNFSQSRIFATAGISSYIMLSEDYQFSYDIDDEGLRKSWSNDTGTRHWMSNAGFSVGYELDIHSNWSLRAEPFIKVPIKEVGWGNVKLYSIGSFISFNYKFSK